MKQCSFLAEQGKGGSSSVDLGRCHLCLVAKSCINPCLPSLVLTVVVNMQTMQIPLLCHGLESYSQGIIKELLGLEAPLAPETEGRKRMPQAQHIRG